MHTLSFAVLSSIIALTAGFNVATYSGFECNGTVISDVAPLTPASGCQKRPVEMYSASLGWADEADNELVLAVFGDSENCCNGQIMIVKSWSDECVYINTGWKSWRIMEPNDINKGKEGELYDCTR